MTRLAIFDFDGTLADSYPLFIDTLNALAARHRFRQVTAEELPGMRGFSAAEVLRHVQLPLWRVPAVVADFQRVMRARIDEIRPFAGVVETLNALADRRLALALATSNSADNVEAVLGTALLKRFAAVESGASLFGKAHRLQRVLKATGIDGAQAIYIGDEIRDADAAAALGVQFGAVAWGYTDIAALARRNPQRIFHVPADLLGLG